MTKMDRDVFRKWEHIVDDVEKTKIPVTFIKKLVLKLTGRRQRTLNITALVKQGLSEEEIEIIVSRQLEELDDEITSIDFVLDVEKIALEVQPEADRLLNKL